MKTATRILLLFILLFPAANLIGQCERILFIVDDSGSIDPDEFDDLQISLQRIADSLVLFNPNTEIGWLQYNQFSGNGQNTSPAYHNINAFVSNPIISLFHHGGNGVSDNLPYTIFDLAQNNILGGVGSNTYENVDAIFIFTDANEMYSIDVDVSP